MTRLIRRWLPHGLAVFTAVVVALSASAQESRSKLLDETRKAQEIATQKAESELRTTLTKANSASQSEAVALLKQALNRLESNDDINPDRKTSMIRMLKDRIRLTETVKAGATDDKPIADASRLAKINARKAELEKQAAEREKIKATINAINQLQGQGRTEDADKQAHELAKQFPDNPAARAMGRNGFINARIREGRDSLSDQEKRHATAMKEIDKSSMPIAGDVEFDKKVWAQAGKRSNNKLTEKERTLLDALNKPVQANWRNSRFEDVIEYLSTVSGQPIVIDKRALEDQNLNYDSPVTFVAPKTISMRTALRKVLQDNGLSFVIKDEVIFVTTAKNARDMMVTKVYPIGDLVMAGEFSDGTRYPPAVTMAAEAKIAEMIVEMIRDTIDPMSWQGNGGAGSIKYVPTTKAIVVRQSAEVHMMLKSGLK